MGRCNGKDAVVQDVVDDGARKGRTLDGVGPSAEFVEEDQHGQVVDKHRFARLPIGGLEHLDRRRCRFDVAVEGFEDADDVLHVRRKGRQALLDALFVADVGKNAPKHR